MSDDIKKLKEELNYLRQLKEALDKTTIISKTDENGIITDANEMFEKISGYKKEELIGRPHNIVRHPDMPKSIFKKMWDTIKKGKIFRGVIKNRAKDGRDYYVLANIIPIKDEKGNIKEYIAIRQDITKRIELQKQQETFINNLLRYFLNKLKNPTFAINKYSSLIEEELNKENPNLEKIREYNRYIKKEGLILKRMKKVLKTILDFKQHSIKVEFEKIDLVKLFNYLRKKYETLYKKEIIFNFQSPQIPIISDKKLIVLMFDILFMNALKFSKSKVEVSIHKINNKIEVIIKNDGEKIKEKLKVFDFFNQLKHNFNTQTGMGMFLVKKICNLFDYDIKIKDNQIIIYLPQKPKGVKWKHLNFVYLTKMELKYA